MIRKPRKPLRNYLSDTERIDIFKVLQSIGHNRVSINSLAFASWEECGFYLLVFKRCIVTSTLWNIQESILVSYLLLINLPIKGESSSWNCTSTIIKPSRWERLLRSLTFSSESAAQSIIKSGSIPKHSAMTSIMNLSLNPICRFRATRSSFAAFCWVKRNQLKRRSN